MSFLRRAPFIKRRSGGGTLSAFLPDYPGYPGFDIDIFAEESTIQPDGANATATLSLLSDGTGRYRTETGQGGIVDLITFTWKTGGGTASDYYAFMDTVVGNAFAGGSDATNASLQLNVDRNWLLLSFQAGNVPGSDADQTQSTIRIKNSSGTDLTFKTVQFQTAADVAEIP